MLATLVIGLREGLEAALIVGIIAAFLKRNGRGLGAMWLGVILALVASIGVGVALWLLESALPQAQQEALETVIGAVAVVFVTGMLLWMNRHARSMKKELETSAGAALHDGGATALAVMAFLAVLKEGFETSVFLLATFRAADSAGLAATGAVLGIVISAGIGYGIYAGGVRIDLGRFFRITGAFLVLVAAGLVLTAVRTAHEAGWIVAGQQRTVDLTWLAPNGSVQGALITGMLGIPSDPRAIEVVAWLAYVIPVALLVYWPAKRRPTGAAAVRLRWIVAAGLGAAAIVLAVAVPSAPQAPTDARALTGGGTAEVSGSALLVQQSGATERVTLPAGDATTPRRRVDVLQRTASGSATVSGPATVTLTQVTAANGGRLPVGVNPAQDPGPFTASWSGRTTTTAWTSGSTLVDATRTATTVLTITGGGLSTPRTLTVTGGDTPTVAAWHVTTADVTAGGGRARRGDDGRAGAHPVGRGAAARPPPRRSRGRAHRAPRPTSRSPGRHPDPHPSPPSQEHPLCRQVIVAPASWVPQSSSPTVVALLAACSGTPTASTASSATSDSTVAPVSNGVAKVSIDLVSGSSGDECKVSHSTAKAGPITFTVANTSATGITEVELVQGQRIVGEKENLAPGLAAVSFTSTLTGGAYSIVCPGATAETTAFTVTGKAPASSGSDAATLLATGTKTYGEYVTSTLDDMVTATKNLQTAVDSGDVAAAKKQYALTRPFYEKVESDVEGFVLPGTSATDNKGNLDYLIDMRASNLDPKVGWSGFHAIERDLWQGGKITATTKKYATDLTANVEKLTTLAKSLTYKPEDLANGAAGLLEEVQTSKIKGEEESYSHLDLVDFAANVEGAEQAFANLEPGLKAIDPTLTQQVSDRFTAVTDALVKYQDPKQAGGYELYTAAVKAKDAQSLSQVVQSLQEPLSKIAEKVATA